MIWSRSKNLWRILLCVSICIATRGGVLPAAVPTLTGVTPFGANPGTSIPVKFAGKLDGSARQVWSDDLGLTFTLPDASGNATATIAPDIRPGLHLIRFINSEGATLPVRFAVGPLPILEEKEPNDETLSPQEISKLPVWIQGKLEKAGDVDHYRLTLKKDVPLFLKADGYSLGSPVDLILHVLDRNGAKLATFSDGRNLDPEGFFVPPADGPYTLQIAGFAHPPTADVNFTGSATCVYQITATTGPVVTRIFPAAVPAQGKGSVELRGLNLNVAETRVEVTAGSLDGTGEITSLFPKGATAPIPVLRSRHPILTPGTASAEEPAAIKVPAVIGGRLEKAGAVAAYKIAMKKGDRLIARFWSRSLGLEVDGDLSVKGPSGQQLATNASPADPFTEPSVAWTAAEDGEHTLVVRDLLQRSGERSEFVVEIAPPLPSFSVELSDGKPLRVEAGKNLILKAKATFTNGWKEPLVVRLSTIPEGVFAPDVPVPEKGGDFDITIVAALNAPPGTTQVKLSTWTKATPPTFIGASYSLRGEAKRGDSNSDFARDLWITVTPAVAPPAAPPDKKK
jgi:hypothetical protein